jgi:hypothetical protein
MVTCFLITAGAYYERRKIKILSAAVIEQTVAVVIEQRQFFCIFPSGKVVAIYKEGKK